MKWQHLVTITCGGLLGVLASAPLGATPSAQAAVEHPRDSVVFCCDHGQRKGGRTTGRRCRVIEDSPAAIQACIDDDDFVMGCLRSKFQCNGDDCVCWDK